MKKVLLLAAIVALCYTTANAQIGGLLNKAAKKATEKVTKKLTDKADEAIEKEIESKLDNKLESKETTSTTEALTYESLMKQIPDLPGADQYVKYKEAEMNEQSLRMLSSKVSSFNMKLLSLSTQALAGLGERSLDSAQATEMAYRYTQMATGLSKEEIDKLSTMSEEEQQAYLETHYRQGTAEAAVLKESEAVAKLMEPLQPMIEEWTKAGQKVDEIYAEADIKCKKIYEGYATKLKNASDKERNNVLLQYYGETLPVQRAAVEEALKVRLKEQLPIAEKIEKEMVPIRAKHQDMVTQLLSYPQITATQYFAEPSRLMEIKEF